MVIQHLVRQDSSVATWTSAAGLNPDYITEIRWWEYPDFLKRHVLEAAELMAFEVLDPTLRSRENIQEKAIQLFGDEKFREEMRLLFSSEPKGRLIIPTLKDALKRIKELERRVTALEKRLEEK